MEDEDSTERDARDLPHQCGDCGEARDYKNVDMVEHPDESRGSFPICNDKPCSIDAVDEAESSDSDSFKVDETLE